jgi:predicted membrane-bound spermidine synthase
MTSRRVLPALLLLFIGSGCAALVYEIVWFQLLQLVIGSSAISLGVLLGTFMGGMCLGSLALSYVVPARQHPLRIYAFLELGIALIGLLVLVGMPLISGVYTAWAGSGLAGLLFRGVIAGVCLLPPTLLMGATLPAISRWVEATPEGVSPRRRLLAGRNADGLWRTDPWLYKSGPGEQEGNVSRRACTGDCRVSWCGRPRKNPQKHKCRRSRRVRSRCLIKN